VWQQGRRMGCSPGRSGCSHRLLKWKTWSANRAIVNAHTWFSAVIPVIGIGSARTRARTKYEQSIMLTHPEQSLSVPA
jgi:hypothetical protein